MLDAVGSREREEGLFADDLVHERVDGGDFAVGQEDRAGLRTERHDVAGAVVLLVAAGGLVLLDDAGIVFGGGSGARDADLRAAVHGERVDVEIRLGIMGEGGRRAEAFEVRERLVVYGVGMDVRARGELDLGAGDAEESQGIAFGELRRFGGVHDVVGDGGDLRGFGGTGHEGVEGSENSHGNVLRVEFGIAVEKFYLIIYTPEADSAREKRKKDG